MSRLMEQFAPFTGMYKKDPMSDNSTVSALCQKEIMEKVLASFNHSIACPYELNYI